MRDSCMMSIAILWNFSSKSFRTLVSWSLDSACICLFEKKSVRIIVPTIPIDCARLSVSQNPIKTIRDS